MNIQVAREEQFEEIMEIINSAKRHLREQGIDQWQSGYPDEECIRGDIANQKGFLLVDEGDVLGYFCMDFDGEPAYDGLMGEWESSEPYVVVHRLALSDQARGKGASDTVFRLVEQYAKEQDVYSFRVDTDADNRKMQHILKKNGFTYRGKIWFDNSEKIAFDKSMA